jgi:ABC-2 type transport system permease protein
MSTLTARPPPMSDDSDLVKVVPVTPARVLSSEWTKLRSLRSTALTLVAGFVLMVERR